MKKTLVIAEAGVNHNGNLDNAKRLIYEAAKCGADIVKFQTYKTEELVHQRQKVRLSNKKHNK